MSFRKRSVRPNLNLSKRSVPNEEKGDYTGVPEDERPAIQREKLSEKEATDSTKKNDDGKSSSSPIPGKRLAKRTKVAPKLMNQKKTSDIDLTVSSTRKTPLPKPSISKALHDATAESSFEKSTEECLIIDSPVSKESNEPTNLHNIRDDKFVEVDQSMDVLSVYKLIAGTEEKEVANPDESAVQEDGEENTNAPIGEDSTLEAKDTSKIVKERRLPKRTRIIPKLTARSIKGENDSGRTSLLSNNASVDNIAPLDESHLCGSDSSTRSVVADKQESNVIVGGDRDDTTTNKTSRLQKRVKVRPKLQIRTPKEPVETKINVTKTNVVQESIQVNENNSEDGNDRMVNEKMEDASSRTSKNENGIVNEYELQRHNLVGNVDNEYDNEVSDRTCNGLNTNLNSGVSNSGIDSEKKEIKHVRFTPYDDYENVDDKDDNSNDYFTEISRRNNEVEDENTSKSPLRSENCKYDSNDEYDSMSEGELLGKQLVSKNKVFKPNLSGKRRERLSSFSAYSSCDEDDWSNQKKKNKEKSKKKLDDHSDKEEDIKEETKKKVKAPAREKMDRENLEPNSDIVPKKRKKKSKPAVKNPRTPRINEIRDLSSLTMQELIHYNHPSFKTVELRSKREEDENERVVEIGSTLPEEKKPKVSPKIDEGDDAVMAPQIMINEDGEIVINQESLTIKKKVDDSALKNSAVVYEDALSYGTHLKRKHNTGKRWKIDETLRFYKALSEIGTDFTLMSQAFGRFSRNELKKKFKKEEKVNCDLVDRALSNRLPLNMEMFLRGKEEMKDYLGEQKPVTPDNDDECTEVDPISSMNVVQIECEVEG